MHPKALVKDQMHTEPKFMDIKCLYAFKYTSIVMYIIAYTIFGYGYDTKRKAGLELQFLFL